MRTGRVFGNEFPQDIEGDAPVRSTDRAVDAFHRDADARVVDPVLLGDKETLMARAAHALSRRQDLFEEFLAGADRRLDNVDVLVRLETREADNLLRQM